MIIRSQDKKSITTDLNLFVMNIQGTYEIVTGKRESIGAYSTEEKAIKVLDMICDFYIRMVDVTNNILQASKEDTYVFQMPADEDVEV